MTINNIGLNPFPQSCALNSSLYSNNNCEWSGSGFRRCTQSTLVPQSKPFSMEDMRYWDNVHVPNGEVVPMGCEGSVNMNPMFNQDLFRCPDGTILDMKSQKVVKNPDNNNRSKDCWGDRKIQNPFKHVTGEWNDSEINSFNPYVSQNNPLGLHLDGADLEYQKYSEMKNRELRDNMNDIQKKLLSDVENGLFNSKTRLIEESKRNAKQSSDN